jgi:hypothetical protein
MGSPKEVDGLKACNTLGTLLTYMENDIEIDTKSGGRIYKVKNGDKVESLHLKDFVKQLEKVVHEIADPKGADKENINKADKENINKIVGRINQLDKEGDKKIKGLGSKISTAFRSFFGNLGYIKSSHLNDIRKMAGLKKNLEPDEPFSYENLVNPPSKKPVNPPSKKPVNPQSPQSDTNLISNLDQTELSDSSTDKSPDTKSVNTVSELTPKANEVRLNDLQEMISKLKSKTTGIIEQKKAAIYEKAIKLFNNITDPLKKIEAARLTNADAFKLDKNNTPSYFKESLKEGTDTEFTTTGNFYDYEKTPNKEDVWVDFANVFPGGACFGHGFVQEEIMVAEMPDFADFIAKFTADDNWCNLQTRECNDNFSSTGKTGRDAKKPQHVMEGNPTPLYIKNAHRVLAVKDVYGGKIDKISAETLIKDHVKALDRPQEVNLLAIAAPKLYGKTLEEQWDLNTLKDNFNTLMAGFQLVKDQAEGPPPGPPPCIHSGQIGCGVFNNNPHAIYLLHRLAAQHLGVEIKLHGYKDDDVKAYEASWKDLAPSMKGKSLEDCLGVIANCNPKWIPDNNAKLMKQN